MPDDIRDVPADDDQLLALLGEVLDADDPVPAAAVDAARAADLGRLDAELADLVYDSLVDERPAGAGVRAEPGDDVRSLTFVAGGRTVEVDLRDDELVGRVSPAAGAALELDQPAGRQALPTDDRGRFRAPVVPGPVRLRVTGPDGAATTPWIT